jgi:hypothetical protein
MGQPSDRTVEVRFTPDEALVLFEWVHRLEDDDYLERLPGLLRGEKAALWALSGALERTLAEPFDPDYARLIAEARDRLAGAYEDGTDDS